MQQCAELQQRLRRKDDELDCAVSEASALQKKLAAKLHDEGACSPRRLVPVRGTPCCMYGAVLQLHALLLLRLNQYRLQHRYSGHSCSGVHILWCYCQLSPAHLALTGSALQAECSTSSAVSSFTPEGRRGAGVQGASIESPRAIAPAARHLQDLLLEREQQMQRHQSRIQRLEERFGTRARLGAGARSKGSDESDSDDEEGS